MDLSAWAQTSFGWQAGAAAPNADGTPAYSGSPTTLLGRYEQGWHVVNGPEGKIAAEHTIYTLTAVGLRDRFWLPGYSTADATKARTPKAVRAPRRKDGTVLFYVVHL